MRCSDRLDLRNCRAYTSHRVTLCSRAVSNTRFYGLAYLVVVQTQTAICRGEPGLLSAFTRSDWKGVF